MGFSRMMMGFSIFDSHFLLRTDFLILVVGLEKCSDRRTARHIRDLLSVDHRRRSPE
jgi:hypothetical protein